MSKDRINELMAAYNDKKITLKQFKDELLHQEGWVVLDEVVLDEEKIYPIKGRFIIGLIDLISRFITKEEELKKILNTEFEGILPMDARNAVVDSLRARLVKRLMLVLDRKC